MADQLKACPFCGGKAEVVVSRCGEDCVDTYVSCTSCDARTTGMEAPYSEPEYAISEWNTRAEPVGVPTVQAGDGWKLVPIEPTEQMIQAARDVDQDGMSASYKTIYMSMVAATPANMPASDAASDWVLLPKVMTAAMINAWSGGLAVTTDEIAANTSFQDGWERVIAAAPQQPVAASSEPVKLTDWDRISKAAATACNEYGQWMPERWVQLFVAAYNKE